MSRLTDCVGTHLQQPSNLLERSTLHVVQEQHRPRRRRQRRQMTQIRRVRIPRLTRRSVALTGDRGAVPTEPATFVRCAVHDRPPQIRLQVVCPRQTPATQCGHDRVVTRYAGRRSLGRSRAAGSRSCLRRSCGSWRRGASARPGTRGCSRSRRGSGWPPRSPARRSPTPSSFDIEPSPFLKPPFLASQAARQIEQAGWRRSRCHVGELEGDRLVHDDRLAEGVALLGVLEGVLVGGAGHTERLGAHRGRVASKVAMAGCLPPV
jgi:hypothetical protein